MSPRFGIVRSSFRESGCAGEMIPGSSLLVNVPPWDSIDSSRNEGVT